MAVKHLRLLKFFKGKLEQGEREQPSRGRYVYERSDKILNYREDTACYSAIEWRHVAKILIFQDGVIPFLKKKGWTEEEVVEHYRWLIQDSPFSHMYLNKDPVWCLKNGFPLLCTGSKPTMLFAATLLNVWEHSAGRDCYLSLIRNGGHRLVSLVGSYYLETTEGGGYYLRDKGLKDGHTPFSETSLNKKILRNMLEQNHYGYTVEMLYGDTYNNGLSEIIPLLKRDGGLSKSIFPQLNRNEDVAYTVSSIAEAFNKHFENVLEEWEWDKKENKHAA